MRFFAEDPLPAGCWYVKWIDGYSFIHASGAAAVTVFLEQLPFEDPSRLAHLVTADLPAILGHRRDQDAAAVTRRIQVGYLTVLTLGDVFEGNARIGCLPQSTVPTLMRSMTTQRVGNPMPKPAHWGDAPYRFLNRFEYRVPLPAITLNSNCLSYESDGEEFIVPATAAFQ